METNLRRLLIGEKVPLADEPEPERGRVTRTISTIVYNTEPGQTILTVTEDGDHIVTSLHARRFFPPLVRYENEAAIQERIAALFEAAAFNGDDERPLLERGIVQADQLWGYFREFNMLDGLSLIANEELAPAIEGEIPVFVGNVSSDLAIGVSGTPGVLLETPQGTGIFLSHVGAVVGVRVQC